MAIAHGEAEPWVKGEWVATMEVFREVFRQIPGGQRRFGLPCHILVGHFKAKYLDTVGVERLPACINHLVERAHRWDKHCAAGMVQKAVGALGIATYSHTTMTRDLVLHDLYRKRLISSIPD